MSLSLIVAFDRQGVIGREGDLPWRLPADLRRFKQLTMGHHLIVGRRTFDSIGRVLPGRTMIVVTRQPDWPAPAGVLVALSLDDALAQTHDDSEPFVAGGGELYRLALPRATRLYVTHVDAVVPGDTYFPAWNVADWRLRRAEDSPADERHAFPYSFREYVRERPDAPANDANAEIAEPARR